MKRFFFYVLVKVVFGFLAWFYLRLKGVVVEGKKNIPFGRPTIFYANHPSLLDPFIILTLGFWPKIVFCPSFLPWSLAAEEVMEKFKLKWLLNYVCIPVRRGRGGSEVFRRAESKIKQGQSILIFPEGRRTGREKLSKLKGGIFILWSLCPDAFLVPVKISGSSLVLPPNSFWPKWKKHKIKVSFGQKFLMSTDFKEKKPEEFLKILFDLLEVL